MHVARGTVLTRCRIDDGEFGLTDIHMDAWEVQVTPEGASHATVTFRADGRPDEILDFVPVGPALDALLSGPASHVRSAA